MILLNTTMSSGSVLVELSASAGVLTADWGTNCGDKILLRTHSLLESLSANILVVGSGDLDIRYYVEHKHVQRINLLFPSLLLRLTMRQNDLIKRSQISLQTTSGGSSELRE